MTTTTRGHVEVGWVGADNTVRPTSMTTTTRGQVEVGWVGADNTVRPTSMTTTTRGHVEVGWVGADNTVRPTSMTTTTRGQVEVGWVGADNTVRPTSMTTTTRGQVEVGWVGADNTVRPTSMTTTTRGQVEVSWVGADNTVRPTSMTTTTRGQVEVGWVGADNTVRPTSMTTTTRGQVEVGWVGADNTVRPTSMTTTTRGQVEVGWVGADNTVRPTSMTTTTRGQVEVGWVGADNTVSPTSMTTTLTRGQVEVGWVGADNTVRPTSMTTTRGQVEVGWVGADNTVRPTSMTTTTRGQVEVGWVGADNTVRPTSMTTTTRGQVEVGWVGADNTVRPTSMTTTTRGQVEVGWVGADNTVSPTSMTTTLTRGQVEVGWVGADNTVRPTSMTTTTRGHVEVGWVGADNTVRPTSMTTTLTRGQVEVGWVGADNTVRPTSMTTTTRGQVEVGWVGADNTVRPTSMTTTTRGQVEVGWVGADNTVSPTSMTTTLTRGQVEVGWVGADNTVRPTSMTTTTRGHVEVGWVGADNTVRPTSMTTTLTRGQVEVGWVGADNTVRPTSMTTTRGQVEVGWVGADNTVKTNVYDNNTKTDDKSYIRMFRPHTTTRAHAQAASRKYAIEFQKYVNPPAGGQHANPAAPTNFDTASFSEAAAQANRSWADLAEDNNPEHEDNYTYVQRKKRRRGSAESPAAAAPSSNLRGAGAIRRPRSSTGWAPRAEEIRTTRAHIAEARARQASSTEDHCVYIERSPELEPFHYMRAIERMFGSTREVFQVTKMNGHFLVGLANRGMAERFVNEGLEVEGTLHRAFPFRKRAERITVGNLPFFVGDATVISALSAFGRVTSIAPKLMKAGPYIYNDGRREAFIILREGMTIEGLPTRLNITIKGEAWPAYLSSGIRCSRCRGQGHRRANCPLLAGRTSAPGPATPTSPTSVPSATAPGLPQQPSAQPPPSASPSPTMELSDVPPASRAALLPPAAPRPPPLAPLALPVEDMSPAPPPVIPAPSLRAPGGSVSPQSTKSGPPAQDIEMTVIEESSASSTSSSRTSMRDDLVAFIRRSPTVSFTGTDALGLGREEVKSELKKGPAAVPPTPPLPAPWPAEPAPPAPQERESTPAMATPPPPTSAQMEADLIDKRCDELQLLTIQLMKELNLWPQLDSLYPDLVEAVLYPEDRKGFLRRLSPGDKKVIIQILDKLSEHTRDLHSLTLRDLSELRAALPPSILPPPGSENSAKNEFHREIYREKSNSREYVNPPADGGNVNLAVARGDVTSGLPPATSSNGAARALRNWADCPEDQGPGADDDFTVVRTKKRRRESANSPTAAAPSSNIGGARTSRRPQSSAGSVPRAQEIRTTRAHITEARARQASSSEDLCVYLEHGPELQPFHYLRALDRMLGGTAGVIQVSKVNGHQLLGLANRGLAERLIDEGLEVEGTLLRAFPFRKRAERITVGNLPFFVEDSAIISALKPYGRVTSIAPKLMKAGPYTYNDGRREAFIVLREGMTTERLPTRLEIPIKGEAWPAYLSSGIKCSRCHGQGHRRANCPLLAGRTNAPRPATPISPTSVPPVTAPGLPRQPSAHPPPPASPSPAMETPSASPAARAVTPSAAPRPSTPVAPAVPVEMAPPAPPPVTPAPSLRAPGGSVSPQSTKSGPPAQDIEMTAIEESSASSTSSSRTSMRDDLVAFIQRSPTVSFTGTDALGLGREEVLDLLSSRTKAQRKRGLLTPPQTDALAGLIEQILGLKPAGNTNVYKILHQVKSELKKGPAAVPPTPPLPAPRPAGPTPPVPHGVETKPAMATPPPPLPTPMEEEYVDHEDLMEDLFDELNSDTELKPLLDSGFSTYDLIEAILHRNERALLIAQLSPSQKIIFAGFIDIVIWRAQHCDNHIRQRLANFRKALNS
ncbi:hypothetical protein LAZ67_16002670 [Cordylochernes scorpioides]|uniref:CCHC-type domain-containing protein n=1 Tax=Cordylochernes scorpioides TaxID=51811 RepID=A0ABY6LCI0_9ARAC|nr:hypothetical protein LAZ67_16002670 [Cordylochernes scorpioides]